MDSRMRCNGDGVDMNRLQNGTTYNSYLIFGEDKTALVDASHEKFRGLYMATLQKELARQGRSVDYIIVSHTEPDHSGATRLCDREDSKAYT